MPETRYDINLNTAYQPLAACRWGDVNGPPVLALHGWLDNAASFQPLAAYLPDLHLVALDLPGHGHSAHRPAGTLYHFIDYVPVVLAAADALDWGSFTVLGHSLGAGIASFIAAGAQERVKRLIMIDGLGPVAGAEQEGPDRLRKSLLAQGRAGAKKAPIYPDIQTAVRVRHEATGLSLNAAELLVQRAVEEVSGGLSWCSDPRLRIPSPVYFSEAQVQAMLSAVTAPSLLIQALDGYLISRPQTAERRACMPQLQTVDLPGGHHLHMEQPQAVAEALRSFLNQ
jgi:pimeloyl-ACP methyl ester carboxylesterase